MFQNNKAKSCLYLFFKTKSDLLININYLIYLRQHKASTQQNLCKSYKTSPPTETLGAIMITTFVPPSLLLEESEFEELEMQFE